MVYRSTNSSFGLSSLTLPLLFLFFLLFSPSLAYSQGNFSLTPDDLEVEPDEVFTIDISILLEGGQEASGVSMYLNFDPAVLEVVSLTPNTGTLGVIIEPASFDNTSGTISFSSGTFSNFPTQSFDILEIEFKSLIEATASQISFSTSSPRESIIAFNGQNIIDGPLPTGLVTVQGPVEPCEEVIVYDQEVQTSPFILRASQRIELKPGFSVGPGIEFIARIEDCPPFPNMLLTADDPTEVNTSLNNTEEEKIRPVVGISIRPNPAFSYSEICVQSQQDDDASLPVSITVRNSVGQVFEYFPAQELSREISWCHTINTVQLPAGIYYVQVLSPSKRWVEKLVVAH